MTFGVRQDLVDPTLTPATTLDALAWAGEEVQKHLTSFVTLLCITGLTVENELIAGGFWVIERALRCCWDRTWRSPKQELAQSVSSRSRFRACFSSRRGLAEVNLSSFVHAMSRTRVAIHREASQQNNHPGRTKPSATALTPLAAHSAAASLVLDRLSWFLVKLVLRGRYGQWQCQLKV